MKKYLFIGILIGVFLTSGVVGVVAYNYNAKDVKYTPRDSDWNVNNVEDALKDLKIAKDINSMSVEQDQKIDGNLSKTYTANQEETIIVYLSQTGYMSYYNDIQTTGTILKDTNNLKTSVYAGEVNTSWYIQMRTVVIKLKKDDTVTFNSNGVGYGSGQYSIIHLY